MLAIVNTPGSGSPVEICQVDEPEAAPDEAVVEVRAFSLNRGELLLLANRPEGWRPGQDVSGVVLREAKDGSGPAEGSRVMGLVDQAGWAERVSVPTSQLAPLPDEVSFAQAATLPMAGLTALRALRLGGSLLGSKVLITGAAGGVGRFAVQLAASAGASVTGVARSPERAEGLEDLGASETVATIEEAEGPFDLILEAVGGASFEEALRLVGPKGTVVSFGNSSGERAGFDFFDHMRLYPDGAKLHIFFYSDGQESFGPDLARLVSLVASGRLTPNIGAESSWRNLERVLDELRERKVNGKAVFHPA